MISILKKISFCITIVVFAGSPAAANVTNLSPTKKLVDSFMKANRSTPLTKYTCQVNSSLNACRVYCSSGGSKFLNVSKVHVAYYAERLKRLDGYVAGFTLVVDVEDSANQKDIWATLQSESSCRFEGMEPSL